ncbi:MAG: PhoH family protein [Gemmatimonadetes bacterium]|nr:MAG: PhoH family protein [Gemmatimonadota bacterium]
MELGNIEPLLFFGQNDCNLRLIEDRFETRVFARGSTIFLEGDEDEVEAIADILLQLISIANRGNIIGRQDVLYLLNAANTTKSRAAGGEKNHPAGRYPTKGDVVYHAVGGNKPIRPKTAGQRKYIQAIQKKDIVFGIGPAGTGKTYLAVAMAAAALKSRQVERIILVRPAVAAGENLGFLPGDLQEKVDPYLRPVYDALYDMMGVQKVRTLLSSRVIEVAPLAYMRGRTLNNAFIILDEAQNTTIPQMKMFLTRLGFDSKAVVTGDITQIDLESKEKSGLVGIQQILRAVSGVEFVYLEQTDVVRHRLVQSIIQAFEVHEKSTSATRTPETHSPETFTS